MKRMIGATIREMQSMLAGEKMSSLAFRAGTPSDADSDYRTAAAAAFRLDRSRMVLRRA
ncbi:hypothetical protein KRR38_34085 [Novosphingobium sp. G106]|uniref:hypothetical protein n=1 Tax=Novosphingobium sp. G106 TaxID=2849500 RepID=UPI001C2D3C3A|nr:hypothetical protein [Novosphingobium sp. G106]MBV1692529.1 hypothetical protein [Novosphingobium sp. G106]